MKEYEEDDFLELDILIGRKRQNEPRRQESLRKETSGSVEETKSQNRASSQSPSCIGQRMNSKNERQRSLSKSDSMNAINGFGDISQDALRQGSFAMLHVQFSDNPWNEATARDENSQNQQIPHQVMRQTSQNIQSDEAFGLPMFSNTMSLKANSEDYANYSDNELNEDDTLRPYRNLDSSLYMDPVIYHDHRVEKAARLQLEGVQSRVVSVISKSLVMLKTTSGDADADDEYKILKIEKQYPYSCDFNQAAQERTIYSSQTPVTIQYSTSDPLICTIGNQVGEPKIQLREVCNLSRQLKGSKQFIASKKIMKDFIVVLCEKGRLVLLQEVSQNKIVCKLDTGIKALPPQCSFINKDPYYLSDGQYQIKIDGELLREDLNGGQSQRIGTLITQFDISFVEHHTFHTQNHLSTASITPIREKGGYFMVVGSHIQLFKIAIKEGNKNSSRPSYQIIEVGRINQVIRSQALHHSCQIISTSSPYKIKFNFLILDRISQELIQVDLDFRKGTVKQRTLLQRLMGSATPLSQDKKSFQAVLLDSRKDTIISYDLKRHAITHQLPLVKSKSIRINDCYFQIYKLFKMNHRLLMMIQHTRSVVANLDNLTFNEDTSLSFNEHDHSQRETITSRRDDNTYHSQQCSRYPSYHMVCYNDQRKLRSEITLWKVSSYFPDANVHLDEQQQQNHCCLLEQPDFQVNKESEPAFRACYLSDQLKEKIQTLPQGDRSHFPPYFDQA